MPRAYQKAYEFQVLLLFAAASAAKVSADTIVQ
jgi:hypothetical protein